MDAPATGGRVALGAPGRGKSYLLRALATAHARAGWVVLAADMGNDWAGVDTLDTLPDALPPGTIVRSRVTLDATATPAAAHVDRLAQWAAARPGTLLVVPEAHLSLREGWPLRAATVALVTRHRHVGSSLWLDTQHPARISKAALDDAAHVHAFHTASPRDLRALRLWDARIADSMPTLRSAAVGWHAWLDTYRGTVELARWNGGGFDVAHPSDGRAAP